MNDITIKRWSNMLAALNWVARHTTDLTAAFNVTIERSGVTIYGEAGNLAPLVALLGLPRTRSLDHGDFHNWSGTQGGVVIRIVESEHEVSA